MVQAMTVNAVPTGRPVFHRLVADEVRAWAGRRGTRQREVARLLGISQQQVSPRWKGDIAFPTNELLVLARYWGISVCDFMGPAERAMAEAEARVKTGTAGYPGPDSSIAWKMNSAGQRVVAVPRRRLMAVPDRPLPDVRAAA